MQISLFLMYHANNSKDENLKSASYFFLMYFVKQTLKCSGKQLVIRDINTVKAMLVVILCFGLQTQCSQSVYLSVCRLSSIIYLSLFLVF